MKKMHAAMLVRLFPLTGVSLVTILFSAMGRGQSVPTTFKVSDDTTRGRIAVENNVLKLEFGYKQESRTHYNQGGGNLYLYIDKRFSDTANVISVWNGGTSATQAFASAAGGIGGTQIYAVPDLNNFQSGSYKYAMADNVYSQMLDKPQVTMLAQGPVRVAFRMNVRNPQIQPVQTWYEVTKIWTIAPTGLISLQLDWTILKAGYFSEPASRHQVSTRWKTISRYGHEWSTPPSGPPGSDSRRNSANKWYTWTPDPASVQECGSATPGVNQDALHPDYIRFHDGVPYDFWFWCYGDGLGYEGQGFYRIGYTAFGTSQNSAVLEICHHNRTSIGDGGDAYNVGPMAWWGGDGATKDRYKPLAAQTKWTDTYKMEVRATGWSFPPDTAPSLSTGIVSMARSVNRQSSLDRAAVTYNNGYERPGLNLVNIPISAYVNIYTVRGHLLAAVAPGMATSRATFVGTRFPPGIYICGIGLSEEKKNLLFSVR